MKKLTFFFLLLFTALPLFADDYRVPRAAYSVYAEDLDLDGDVDILVGHNYCSVTDWGGISILENDGSGYFILSDSLYLYSWQRDIQAKNLNTKLLPEIIAMDYISEEDMAYIVISYDANIKETTSFIVNAQWVDALTTGDIDGDSDLDIVVCQGKGQFWGVLYNDGVGQFSEPYYYQVSGYQPYDIACADLNGDGRDDVVVRGLDLEVYFSNEDGFEQLKLEDDWINGELAVFDVDSDGDNDIVTHSEYFGSTVFVIFENNGDDTFTGHDSFYFTPIADHLAAADINNDTFLDLVCVGLEGIYILYNQDDLDFSEPHISSIPGYETEMNGLYCADFDGNGYQDVVTIDYSHTYRDKNVNILFNNGDGGFVESSVTEESNLPESFTLQNYPNPFNNITVIQFSLKKTTNDFSMLIYNTKGVLVKTLFNGHSFPAGIHEVRWQGKDNLGRRVPSGVYCCVITNGSRRKVRKMLLVR